MEAVMTLPAEVHKKSYAGYIVGGLLIAGAVVVTFVVKGKSGLTLWQKIKGETGEEEIPAVTPPVEAPPTGASKWTPESFPLKKGMFGGHIKLLQKKLGISDDGKFGSGTEKSVTAKFGKPTVDINDYNNFVNPPPPVKKGEMAYAKSSPIIIYASPDTSSKKSPVSNVKKLGVIIDITKGAYPFAKIYNATLEYNVGSGYFYVPVQNITNKA